MQKDVFVDGGLAERPKASDLNSEDRGNLIRGFESHALLETGRWQSGLSHLLGKQESPKGDQRFESSSIRDR